MLVAEGLRLSFRDAGGVLFPVLDLPHFAPPPSGLTLIRGASGSGKSTLLYVLAGLQPPDDGLVRFAETEIYALSERRRDEWRRRQVGFIFQDFHLLPELSILANVTVAATFARPEPGLAKRAGELLQRFGVPANRNRVEALSRGERQRVAIARALLFDPPLILADEPTASLDDAAAAVVLQALSELAAEGKTVVLASHDAGALSRADLVVTLEHGHEIATGRAAA